MFFLFAKLRNPIRFCFLLNTKITLSQKLHLDHTENDIMIISVINITYILPNDTITIFENIQPVDTVIIIEFSE